MKGESWNFRNLSQIEKDQINLYYKKKDYRNLVYYLILLKRTPGTNCTPCLIQNVSSWVIYAKHKGYL